jgi:hypothetical protein
MSEITFMNWNIGQDDPADHYPWTWSSYADDDGDTQVGSISTPNGKRDNGAMHTYWTVAPNVWEPTGRLICHVVNMWAHKKFGTSVPASVLPPTESDTP